MSEELEPTLSILTAPRARLIKSSQVLNAALRELLKPDQIPTEWEGSGGVLHAEELIRLSQRWVRGNGSRRGLLEQHHQRHLGGG